MLKFSANLGFLWTNRPLLQAIRAANRSGFEAIELHFPYHVPANLVRAACLRYDLTLLSINTSISGSQCPHFGLAAVPGKTEEFRELVQESFAYAQTARAAFVHIMAGKIEAAQHQEAQKTLIENLKWSADLAEKANVKILLEPLNTMDAPDYFYARVEQAVEIIQTIGHSHIKLMFDAYHVGRMADDIITTLQMNYGYIGHIQIASIPDRAQPDHGDFDYSHLFEALETQQYPGWIGCEYTPRGRVEDTLGWREKWQKKWQKKQ